MWTIFLGIAIGCMPLSVLAWLKGRNSEKKVKQIRLLHWLMVGMFLTAFFLFLALHKGAAEQSALAWPRSFLLAVFNAMQVFATGCEFAVITDSISACPQSLQSVYMAAFAMVFVFAPVLTFGFALSLFKNVTSRIRFLGLRGKELFIFSELNEKSTILATDIRKKNPNCGIVFTDVYEDETEENAELRTTAKRLGAVCFSKDILLLSFGRRKGNKQISFFLIGEKESENLNQALKLLETYHELDNGRVYVFSTSVESEILLTAADKGTLKVRRINEVRSLINRILYEDGCKLFDEAKAGEDGWKHIGAVVVGMGRHGTQMMKSLAWYAQMDGYRLHLTGFDKDPLAQERFTALAPALMEGKDNDENKDDEAWCDIRICSETDVQTASFAKKLAELKNTTYVLVALGTDELNINTAVMLRMYFERMHIHPTIQAIVYNTRQKNALQGIKNYSGQHYDVDFIGDLESSYAENVVIDSELEAKGLSVHLGYSPGQEETFWAYEYNYQSSVASAIHHRARVHCGIANLDKRAEELTAEEKRPIQRLEHRRWLAYMRSEGFIYSGLRAKTSRNNLGKMHNDMVAFEHLDDSDIEKDSNVVLSVNKV